MSLKRMMELYAPTEPAPAPEAETPSSEDDHGLSIIDADFVTARRTLRGTMVGPERRLSDLLNSSVPALEGRFLSVLPTGAAHFAPAEAGLGELTKSAILFAIPRSEPARPRGTSNPEWKPLTAHRCRVLLDSYEIEGLVHLDPALQPLIALRAGGKLFLPVTRASVHCPADAVCGYDAVIVNRERVELIELRS